MTQTEMEFLCTQERNALALQGELCTPAFLASRAASCRAGHQAARFSVAMMGMRMTALSPPSML